jgi:hypothetical protein
MMRACTAKSDRTRLTALVPYCDPTISVSRRTPKPYRLSVSQYQKGVKLSQNRAEPLTKERIDKPERFCDDRETENGETLFLEDLLVFVSIRKQLRDYTLQQQKNGLPASP